MQSNTYFQRYGRWLLRSASESKTKGDIVMSEKNIGLPSGYSVEADKEFGFVYKRHGYLTGFSSQEDNYEARDVIWRDRMNMKYRLYFYRRNPQTHITPF